MFPSCNLMWNRLGYLFLLSEELNNGRVTTDFCKLDNPDRSDQEGLKSVYDIHSVGAVACRRQQQSKVYFSNLFKEVLPSSTSYQIPAKRDVLLQVNNTT